jgi:DNA-binding NtrC family response regulator
MSSTTIDLPVEQTPLTARAHETLARQGKVDAVLANFIEIILGKGIPICGIKATCAGQIHELEVPGADTYTSTDELYVKVEGGYTDLHIWFRDHLSDSVREEIVDIALLASHRIELLLQGRLKTERRERNKPIASTAIEGFIGNTDLIRAIESVVERAAACDWTVLISGESGTGKGLAARAIHNLSKRKSGPFIEANCGAWPEGLIEAELFGHERGAFTGANRQHKGCFEQANGGTLFLDEIGELPPKMQVKLLHVLQERRFKRLGGEQVIAVDLRVIAATNRDLPYEIVQGQFRPDLFFRLDQINLHMPSLREHPADIPALIEHFIKQFAKSLSYEVFPQITKDGMHRLMRHYWDGNVRELETKIRHLVLDAGDNGVITPADIELELSKYKRNDTKKTSQISQASKMEQEFDSHELAIEVPWHIGQSVDVFTKEAKKLLVETILKLAGGDHIKAAKWLGLKDTAFYHRRRRLKQHFKTFGNT